MCLPVWPVCFFAGWTIKLAHKVGRPAKNSNKFRLVLDVFSRVFQHLLIVFTIYLFYICQLYLYFTKALYITPYPIRPFPILRNTDFLLWKYMLTLSLTRLTYIPLHALPHSHSHRVLQCRILARVGVCVPY